MKYYHTSANSKDEFLDKRDWRRYMRHQRQLAKRIKEAKKGRLK